MKFKRVLIKLSGEALAGDDSKGIEFDKVLDVCKEISDIT